MSAAVLPPYETAPVLERILDPYEKWAESGYAEGVVDFLPSLGREPLLLSPSSVAAVFQTAGSGIRADEADDADRAEFTRRFEFVERLIDELMTRERQIRDRYYASRNRGMVHRTIVMLGAIGLFTAAAVALPAWAITVTGMLMGGVAALAYHRFSSRAESLRSIYLFEERAARIIAEMPWMADAERIDPREPLEDTH